VLGEAVSHIDSDQTSRAEELRAAFDRTFAEPPRTQVVEPLDFLAITLGGDPFAIRISETGGLFSDRRITPVPTAVRELRGIAGVRGALVPVYDLGLLMGYPALGSTRWLVMAREAAVAFAFDAFDGQLRLDSDAIIPHEAAAREHVRDVVRAPDLSRPIVSLASVIAALGKRIPESVPRKEH
jgi:purine-binding chemotaxis protein CheW